MHAIEVDSRAIEYLTEQHPGLNVRHEDVLKVDWETYRKCCVVGNLPYHIVSQILLSLLETQPGTVKNCLLMMQKEVAARIVARPRTKSYGILSVITQLHGEPRLMFDVPPKAFVPVPKVTSSVVCIDMEKGYEKFDVWNVTLRRRLRTVLKAAFGQRRKMMRNSLRVLCEELGTELDERWCQKRAEEIEPGEFLDIVAQLFGEEGTGEDRKGEEGRGEWETVWRQ